LNVFGGLPNNVTGGVVQTNVEISCLHLRYFGGFGCIINRSRVVDCSRGRSVVEKARTLRNGTAYFSRRFPNYLSKMEVRGIRRIILVFVCNEGGNGGRNFEVTSTGNDVFSVRLVV